MCRSILIAWCVLLVAPSAAHGATGDVVRQFPTPGRCPTGLTFDGESLWLADRRSDLLYRIDPNDGHVIESLTAPGYQVEGLTTEGGFLWVLDAEQKTAFKLNPKTGIAEHSITVHCSSPQGLAFDGEHLWVADTKQDRLHQISTEDGTTITEVPSPSDDPHGLTYDGKYLWVSERSDDMIYMVCPEDGSVVVGFPSPSRFPRGLAFDGEFLWNVDYQTDTIYRIKLRDDATHVRLESKRETLEYVHQVRNYGPGELTSLDIYLAIPHDLPGQKLLGRLTFTPEPDGFVADKWGQKMAHYHYENVPAGQFATVSWEAGVELYKTRYFLFPEKVGSLSDIPDDIKELYLRDGSKFWVNDPYIQKTARDLVGDETNCYWIARKLFEHVTKKMHYELNGGWNVAPTVLKRGSGSCSEYSFVFIALCRAAGLPARYVGSVVIRGDDASTDNDLFHRWPEVYLPNYAWVPMDPSSGGGIFEHPAKKAAVIGYRDNRYLITTIGGGGSEYLEWEYNSNATWKSKGPCKVETERFGEWSPLGEAHGQEDLP
jgi:sugar lactone lactonase YvrE